MERRCFLSKSLNCSRDNRLYQFPFKELDVVTAWLREIPKQLYLNIKNPSFICEAHFEAKFIQMPNELHPQAVPTIFNQLNEIDLHHSRCRFCLKAIDPEESAVEINNYIKMQFFIITNTELNDSDELSHLICYVCFNSACDLASFKTKLLKNQKKLADALENQKSNPIDIAMFEVEEAESLPQPKFEIKDEDNGNSQSSEQLEEQLFGDKVEEALYEEHLEPYVEEILAIESCNETTQKETAVPEAITTERRKLCPDCGKTYSMSAYKRHYERVHLRLKRFHCDFCDYKSYSRNHIEIHLLSHLKIKSHYCDQCGAAFGSGNILRQHFLTHQNDRPFKCEHEGCSISFKSVFALRRHQKTHAEKKRSFQCDSCSAKFADKWHLKRHQNGHQKQSHPCGACEKVFGTEERLRAHQIYHRPPRFQCKLCSKQFYKNPDLTNHFKTHAGQKDFQCKLCANAYFKSAHLNRHMKLHQKELKPNDQTSMQ